MSASRSRRRPARLPGPERADHESPERSYSAGRFSASTASSRRRGRAVPVFPARARFRFSARGSSPWKIGRSCRSSWSTPPPTPAPARSGRRSSTPTPPRARHDRVRPAGPGTSERSHPPPPCPRSRHAADRRHHPAGLRRLAPDPTGREPGWPDHRAGLPVVTIRGLKDRRPHHRLPTDARNDCTCASRPPRASRPGYALLDSQGQVLVQSDGLSTADPEDSIDQDLAAGTTPSRSKPRGNGDDTLTAALTPTSSPFQPIAINPGSHYGAMVIGDFFGDGIADLAAPDGIHRGTRGRDLRGPLSRPRPSHPGGRAHHGHDRRRFQRRREARPGRRL